MMIILKKKIKYVRSIYRKFIGILFSISINKNKFNNDSKRILSIYDTTKQPFAIGDFLVFQVSTLINCEKINKCKTDIAIIYNPKKPSECDRVFLKIVGKDNILLQISSLMLTMTVNKYLGSIFIFDSPTIAKEYIKNNSNKYRKIFPDLKDQLSGNYLNNLVFEKIIFPYYLEYKNLPNLEPNKALRNWANNFILHHVDEFVTVTVNIRNNPYWGVERNSLINEWTLFFNYCNDRFPVKFLVICSKEEIVNEWRTYPNIIILKDHHTELDQELALIVESDFHMGANSGPAAMAYFNSKPYFVFGLNAKDISYENPLNIKIIQSIGHNKFRFIFSQKAQSFTSERESFSLLLESFQEMFTLAKVSFKSKNLKSSKFNSEKRYSWIR